MLYERSTESEDMSDTSTNAQFDCYRQDNAVFTRGGEINIQIPIFTRRVNIRINNPVCIIVNGNSFNTNGIEFKLNVDR